MRQKPGLPSMPYRKEPRMSEGGLRIGYADPPYPGQSLKHYGDHPDYAGEVDHFELAEQLREFDGWILHTSSPCLFHVQTALAASGEVAADENFKTGTYRTMAWVKPFAAFKPNVPVAYAWEPVLVKPVRKPEVSGRMVMRDWLAENITMKRGLTGAKPDRLCRWLFEVVGADPADELVDMFPGSGAVSDAWNSWRSEPRIEFPPMPEAEPFEAFEGNAPRRSESEAHKPDQIRGGV